MHDVFVELGRLNPEDAVLLFDPDADELHGALAELRSRASTDSGQQLFFYYSGHANESALLLGSEQLPFDEIHEFLRDERAQVRLALVDSCRSGALSQVKGGELQPGVDIRWTFEQPVQGAVLITSSAAEEASVERDDIGGSLFTHFVVSGLRGAADGDDDGKVTLEEVFDYAYNHTLARSTESRSGTQHPTYEYQITGQRQLVLSWLDLPSFMTFGENLSGTYVVFGRVGNQVVAELSKEPGSRRQLWLPAGDYYIKKRIPSAVLLQKVSLAKGEQHEVMDHEMHTVPYEEDVTKGHLSETFRPTWKYGAPFVDKTAHTLRRGEVSVGLLAAAFGLNDDVTLGTIPIADLFLTPNLFARFRLIHGDALVWSMHTGFSQSFLGRVVNNDKRSSTSLEAGTTLSWIVASPLTLSLLATWIMESRPDHESGAEWESQIARAGGSITWLLGEHDLIQLVAEVEHTFVGPSEGNVGGSTDWSGRLLYAHSWDVFRIAGGVGRSSGISDALEIESYIFPYLDLWWRW